jgi:DNA polymerase III subunit epsilon
VSALSSDALRSYRELAFPPDATAWQHATFSVIDLETTGLDPAYDEIISFATVTVADGRIRLDDARYELVCPNHMPDWDTIRIHGLREADLEEAKPLDEVLDVLIEALSGRVLVAHVAAVERGFLGAALSKVGEKLRNPIVDTAALDQELRRLRGQPAASGDPVGLSEMARALGLPVHRPHEADGDALTTAQAFLALATHLDEFELQTVGSLQKLEGATIRPGPVSRFLAILQRRGSARP